MPSRSHLTRPKPRNATVDLGDGDMVSITFDANKITPAWMRDAQTRDEAKDSYSLAKALSEVMIGWDVTEDDGSAFPPSSDNIGVFSYPVQSELLERILNAAVPSSEEGNDSGTTSSGPTPTSTSEPESRQNGPAPSPSPQPSEFLPTT